MKRAVRISDREAAVYNLKYNPSSETRPYKCVVNAFEAAGFRNVAGSTQRDWNGFWGIDRSIEIQKMCKHQKLNHFPGCWNLGRKGRFFFNGIPRYDDDNNSVFRKCTIHAIKD
jgi:tubulin polyglutamylase TTLL4